jgi:hypothetical protein
MTDGYTDVRILECSRRQSLEAQMSSTNPALFTTKLGENVVLKPGDKVNVEYAFINERGCGADTIEIKGKSLNATQEFEFTDLQPHMDAASNSYDPIARKHMTYSQYETATPTPVTKHLRDDEMHVETSYYKTTNGEGYVFLPRRSVIDGAIPTYTHEEYGPVAPGTNPNHVAPGIYFKEVNSGLWNDKELTGYYANTRCFVERGHGGMWTQNKTTIKDEANLCRADCIFIPPYATGSHATTKHFDGYYKLASDGSRYTLMVRDKTYFDLSWNSNANVGDFKALDRDPALRPYSIYKELKTIKVDVGYNSPSNIATKITEQLQRADDPIHWTTYDDSKYPDSGNQLSMVQTYATTQDTETYKAFNCASLGNMTSEGFAAFQTDADATRDKAALYDSSYQYIGCKRPDLFVAGRAISKGSSPSQALSLIRNDLFKSSTDQVVITSWEWTQDVTNPDGSITKGNLEKLRDLFEVQGRYPELFENNYEHFVDPTTGKVVRTIKNCRFLHMNRFKFTTQSMLGDDGYVLNTTTSQNMTDRIYSKSSVPLFVGYQPEKAYLRGNGHGLENICFGFATKSEAIGGKYYIQLNPSLSGGIPQYIFDNGEVVGTDVKLAKNSFILGWDWHFSAYSTCCLLNFSGYVNDVFGVADGSFGVKNLVGSTTSISVAPLIQKSYVGANNMALTFQDNGHFAWEYMHTAENVGQRFNAGSTQQKLGTENTNPILEDAGNECYKINKRLQYWTWSPEMKPYDVDLTAYGIAINPRDFPRPKTDDKNQTLVPHTYSPLNSNIQPGSIMDAHSGVSMDFGKCYPEAVFDDGLLGILGFTYEQFNPTVVNGANNLQARVTYDNIYNLPLATTNCEVTSTDQKNYVMNIYGGIQYTTQVTTPMVLTGWGTTICNGLYIADENPASTKDFGAKTEYTRETWSTIQPAIVEQTKSFYLAAEALPRKMLRPYYTIRTDLITDDKYVGGLNGGKRLPIIAVVNKENGDGDFYFSSGSDIVFTITKQINVTSVTTSIHDANQSYARVDEDCAVVYKVLRQRAVDPNIVEEVLGKNAQI